MIFKFAAKSAHLPCEHALWCAGKRRMWLDIQCIEHSGVAKTKTSITNACLGNIDV
jgi:hypothetical protein